MQTRPASSEPKGRKKPSSLSQWPNLTQLGFAMHEEASWTVARKSVQARGEIQMAKKDCPHPLVSFSLPHIRPNPSVRLIIFLPILLNLFAKSQNSIARWVSSESKQFPTFLMQEEDGNMPIHIYKLNRIEN